MAMALTNGALKSFRRTVSQFKHQTSFQTPPSKNLGPFSRAIISSLRPLQMGTLSVNEVVFESRRTNLVFAERSIIPPKNDNTRYLHDWSLDSDIEEEIEVLLMATLCDAIDFAFTPTPKRFMMYSDHNGYTTFFSATKGGLNRIATPLTEEGFAPQQFTRRF